MPKRTQQTDIFNKAMNIKNCVSVCDVKSAYSHITEKYWVKHIFGWLYMCCSICVSVHTICNVSTQIPTNQSSKAALPHEARQ